MRQDTPKLPVDLQAINIDNDRFRLTSLNRRFILFDTDDDDPYFPYSTMTLNYFNGAYEQLTNERPLSKNSR